MGLDNLFGLRKKEERFYSFREEKKIFQKKMDLFYIASYFLFGKNNYYFREGKK